MARMELRQLRIVRRRRRGAALPPRGRAPAPGAAERQPADPHARGRARRPALRAQPPRRRAHRRPARRCSPRRASCWLAPTRPRPWRAPTGLGAARPPAAQPDPVADRRHRRRDRRRVPRAVPRRRARSSSVGNTMLHVEQLHAGDIDVGFVRPPLEDPAPRGAACSGASRWCACSRGSPAGEADDGAAAATSTTSRSSGGPRATARARGGRCAARSTASRRGRRSPAPSPRRSGSSRPSPRARGSRSSCSSARAACAIPGAVYRRFASPEPTMGIALAWRRGDTLPTLQRLREVAAGRSSRAGLVLSPCYRRSITRTALPSLRGTPPGSTIVTGIRIPVWSRRRTSSRSLRAARSISGSGRFALDAHLVHLTRALDDQAVVGTHLLDAEEQRLDGGREEVDAADDQHVVEPAPQGSDARQRAPAAARLGC